MFYLCVRHSALVFEDYYHSFKNYNVLIQKVELYFGNLDALLVISMDIWIFFYIACVSFISSQSSQTIFPSMRFFWVGGLEVSEVWWLMRNGIKQGLSFIIFCLSNISYSLFSLLCKFLHLKIYLTIIRLPSSMKDCMVVEMNCYPAGVHLFILFWK